MMGEECDAAMSLAGGEGGGVGGGGGISFNQTAPLSSLESKSKLTFHLTSPSKII